jgi:hypothetical protein
MTALRFPIILYMITNLFGSVGSAGRRRGSYSGTCVVAEGDDLGQRPRLQDQRFNLRSVRLLCFSWSFAGAGEVTRPVPLSGCGGQAY